ncbi:glycosyltransferase family 1 protein [soil metagenome]
MRVAVTLEQCWHRVPGGTAAAAIETVRALVSRGDVDLVGVSARHRRPPPPDWTPPIPALALPLPRLALYEAWHRLRRPGVERATGPVDVIHATGYAMPPRTAPLVVSIHDLAYLHEPGHFTAHGLRFLNRGLDLARAEADVVLCPSRATVADCERVGFDRSRLRLVPLGVDAIPAAPADVERVRRQHGLGRYVLWVGTIEPRKNLPRLLEAFRRLDRSDVELALVGPTGWHESLTPHLDGLADRVRLLGFVPGGDLAPLYAGAELFCFPSLREGFGLPVLAAMAQGTPVVSSAATSNEEIVEGAGVLVDPTDPAAIAAAMAELLDDPERAAKLAAMGAERAATYTWERTATLTTAAYAEAIGTS